MRISIEKGNVVSVFEQAGSKQRCGKNKVSRRVVEGANAGSLNRFVGSACRQELFGVAVSVYPWRRQPQPKLIQLPLSATAEEKSIKSRW